MRRDLKKGSEKGGGKNPFYIHLGFSMHENFCEFSEKNQSWDQI